MKTYEDLRDQLRAEYAEKVQQGDRDPFALTEILSSKNPIKRAVRAWNSNRKFKLFFKLRTSIVMDDLERFQVEYKEEKISGSSITNSLNGYSAEISDLVAIRPTKKVEDCFTLKELKLFYLGYPGAVSWFRNVSGNDHWVFGRFSSYLCGNIKFSSPFPSYDTLDLGQVQLAKANSDFLDAIVKGPQLFTQYSFGPNGANNLELSNMIDKYREEHPGKAFFIPPSDEIPIVKLFEPIQKEVVCLSQKVLLDDVKPKSVNFFRRSADK